MTRFANHGKPGFDVGILLANRQRQSRGYFLPVGDQHSTRTGLENEGAAWSNPRRKQFTGLYRSISVQFGYENNLILLLAIAILLNPITIAIHFQKLEVCCVDCM